MLRFSF